MDRRATARPLLHNRAREKARKDLWWDIAIPDYTDLVDAIVGERISIAAEMIMAHLSINIRMCHASQKKERCVVGKQSLPGDITRARDFSRRMGDQIEMIQCIRGRIGDDRDAILAVQDRPDLVPAEGPPSALSRGKGRSEDAAGTCDMEPASKRARMAEAQTQCSHITVTNGDRFIPLTPEIEKASGPSTTEYDRGYSDTSDDEGRDQSNVMDSSEYSPVSDAEQEPRKVKTEDLRMAQAHCGNKYRGKPGKSGFLGRSRALSGLFGHTLPGFPGLRRAFWQS
jgi:hypothetical protein